MRTPTVIEHKSLHSECLQPFSTWFHLDISGHFFFTGTPCMHSQKLQTSVGSADLSLLSGSRHSVKSSMHWHINNNSCSRMKVKRKILHVSQVTHQFGGYLWFQQQEHFGRFKGGAWKPRTPLLWVRKNPRKKKADKASIKKTGSPLSLRSP